MYGTNLTDLEGQWGEMSISVSDTDMVLSFPYNEEAIFYLKKIEGAEFSSSDKSWSLPITEDNWRKVRDTVEAVRESFERAKRKAEHRAEVQLEIADSVLAKLQRDFDYPNLSLEVIEGDIAISFPYNPKAVAIIRKIDGRRWDGDVKAWRIPADEEKKIRSALKSLRKVLA